MAPSLTRRDALKLGAALPVAASGCGAGSLDVDAETVPEDPARFPRTVMAGDATDTTVVLAVFVADASPVTLRVWRAADPASIVDERAVQPDADGFVKLKLTGLEAGVAHAYAWFTGAFPDVTGRSLIGRFRTAPPPGDRRPVTVALFSCIGSGSLLPDFVQPGQTEPFTWPILTMAGGLDADVLVHVGDQAYLDEIWHAGGTYPQYLEAWGAAHAGSYRDVWPTATLYVTWDDHEITDNRFVDPWTTAPEDVARLEAGKRAWFRVMPIDGDDPATTPVWRSFRWGDTVEIVLLDCRYDRAGPPDDPLVSDDQLAFLVERIEQSPCRFVCVCTDKPFADIQLDTIPYPGGQERWQGHPAEREPVLEALDRVGAGKVIFLTGDIHMNYVGRCSRTGERARDLTWEICTTSGNTNPSVDFLAADQFVFTEGLPHVPLVTFFPDEDEVWVRFHAPDGTVTWERRLAMR